MKRKIATKEQMKMFLTRLGKNSKAVITGDVTQIDLPNAFSGLVHALPLINKISGISVCEFKNTDVMRHPLVKKIIKAYEVKKLMIKSFLINNIKDEYAPDSASYCLSNGLSCSRAQLKTQK